MEQNSRNETKSTTSRGHRLRSVLRGWLIEAAGMLEVGIAALVLAGLLFSAVPLIRWMPGLLSYGNDVEIRSFLERALDIVIGIEFIKMLSKHSPGSSLEVLMYAIARHMVIGHESASENLLSVCAIALIFIVRKYFFVPAFGAHLPSGEPVPDTENISLHLPKPKRRAGLSAEACEGNKAKPNDSDSL